jgi:hypothetical protein
MPKIRCDNVIEIIFPNVHLITSASKRPTARVTGKGGSWQRKPSDAEPAVRGCDPESAGSAPHLSGAPNQDRKTAIIFPERNRPAVDDR